MKQFAATLLALTIAGMGFAQQEEMVIIRDTFPGKNDQQKVITIRLKGDQAGEKKYVVEIEGDKVKVNGKDVADLKDIDVTVGKNRMIHFGNGKPVRINGLPLEKLKEISRERGLNGRVDGFDWVEENRAYLGISMEKTADGVLIKDVEENSAAAKAGLKEGDIVVKLDGKEVKTEMDITKTVGAHKPGDELEIVYKRAGKQQNGRAALGKRKSPDAFAFSFDGDGNNPFTEEKIPGQNFEFNLANPPSGNFRMFRDGDEFPGVAGLLGNRPRLGVSVKETEEGKGLEVTEVEDASAAAKAGLKKGDMITEAGGKAVNAVEDIRKVVNENKDKPFTIKYSRDGKQMTTEVKFPKKLKETDL